ncbi:unnamed protein product [Mytilus coruscus]|uniref:Uncharacterized protein n=1 Tax=Mytilus coruscus TaxID=42192 RepID=A0A6J8ANH2_MYTCO|nr:unnamed protein product [Mytilus coruscus]
MSTNENQRQLSETQLAKIEEMNSNSCVFKRKGNEEQFNVNSKVANKMKEARCFLREDPEQTEQTQKAAQSISEVQRPGKYYKCGIPGNWRVDHQTGAFGEVMQRNKKDEISKHVNSFDKTVDNFDSSDKSTTSNETHSQFVKLDYTVKNTVAKVKSNDSQRLGLQIIMYLDDGIGEANEINKGNFYSLTVRYTLRSAGFLIAKKVCNSEPIQSVTWLGLVWDMKNGTVNVTETRLIKLKDTLNVIIPRLEKGGIKVTARFLASIIGQIISMQGDMGPVVRLRTRNKGSSKSVVQSAVYGIKWAHNIQGIQDPTTDSFVVNLMEAAKRQPHRPRVKKDHMTADVLINLCSKYKDSNHLLVIRDLTVIILCFAGFSSL